MKKILFAAVAATVALMAISCEKDNKEEAEDSAVAAFTLGCKTSEDFDSIYYVTVDYKLNDASGTTQKVTNHSVSNGIELTGISCPCTLEATFHYRVKGTVDETRTYDLTFGGTIEAASYANKDIVDEWTGGDGIITAKGVSGANVKEYIDGMNDSAVTTVISISEKGKISVK